MQRWGERAHLTLNPSPNSGPKFGPKKGQVLRDDRDSDRLLSKTKGAECESYGYGAIAMSKSTQFSACGSLAAVGAWMRHKGIGQTVKEPVVIQPKVLRYSALDKLLAALINILAGGHGLVEVNTRVKADEGLQRALGRSGCAEQSVISDTLDACTSPSVEQMPPLPRTAWRRRPRSACGPSRLARPRRRAGRTGRLFARSAFALPASSAGPSCRRTTGRRRDERLLGSGEAPAGPSMGTGGSLAV